MEILRDLRQRHIDAYFPLLRDITDQLSSPEYAGRVVRAAAAVGIISGLAPEDVDELHPGLTIKLAKQVNEAVAEALTIPPD